MYLFMGFFLSSMYSKNELKLDFKLSRNIPKHPEFGQSGSRKSRSPYKGTGFGQKTGSGRTSSDGVAGKLGGDRSGARGGKSLWPIGRDACVCTDFCCRVIDYPLSLNAAAIP